jgi:hypothetical protein
MPGRDHDANDAASETPRRRDFLRYSGGAAAAGGIAGAITGAGISAPESAAAQTMSMPLPSGTPMQGQVPVATGDDLGDSAWGTVGRTATITVAASNTAVTSLALASADYVCTGSGDETIINTAIAALPGVGGRVVLLEGTYTCTGPIIVDQNYVTLEGQGTGFNTIIGVASNPFSTTTTRSGAIILGNTLLTPPAADRVGIGLRHLAVDVGAGQSGVNQGTGHGVVVGCSGWLIEDVQVQHCSGDAFHYSQDLLALPTNSTTTTGTQSMTSSTSTPNINVANTGSWPTSGTFVINTASSGGSSAATLAYVTYSGITGDTFNNCTAKFAGTSFSIPAGSTVTSVANANDMITMNTYAQQFGGDGYFISPQIQDCTWMNAKAAGSSTAKPGTASSVQNGFRVWGGECKFINCHPFFCSGSGMMVSDVNASGNAITVDGGEWENNCIAGISVISNGQAVWIGNGASFYGNGLSGSGSDISLTGGAKNVRINRCQFNSGSISPTTAAQQIYAASATYCSVTDSFFFNNNTTIPNVYLDGATGAVSNFLITGNRLTDGTSGALGVYLGGNTTFCTVSGNIIDVPITENSTGGTPNSNTITQNIFAGPLASVTVTGANSYAWGNVPYTPGPPSALPAAMLPAAAPRNFAPANPTGTASTSPVMMGMGSTVTYTPASSGLVLVTVSGAWTTATAATNVVLSPRYGTGAAPGNSVAETGTRWGIGSTDLAAKGNSTTGTVDLFTFTAILSLTRGTPYWFDMAFATGSASDTASLSNMNFAIAELA